MKRIATNPDPSGEDRVARVEYPNEVVSRDRGPGLHQLEHHPDAAEMPPAIGNMSIPTPTSTPSDNQIHP